MCPGNGDSGFIRHQFSEKVCTLVNGNVSLSGGVHFNIVIGNGRGSDDPIRALNVARMMSDENRHASRSKIRRERCERAIGAGYSVSAFFQEAGYGGESASANADEVYVCHVRYQFQFRCIRQE